METDIGNSMIMEKAIETCVSHDISNPNEIGQSLALTALPTSSVTLHVDEPTARPNFTWDVNRHPTAQYDALCEVIAGLGIMYKLPDGKLLVLEVGKAPRAINDSTDLEAFLRENININVIQKGNQTGFSIPSQDRSVLLRSVQLKNKLPTVDRICTTPTYGSDWNITMPGYNDGPPGQRYFYTGPSVVPAREPNFINMFLNEMCFETIADKVAALAFALTVMLRFFWAGGKPFIGITANRSHAGKDTIVDFAIGMTRMEEVSWHHADWALQNEAVGVLADPDVGCLVIGNIRANRGNIIQSAFIERTVTSNRSVMQSSKRRSIYNRNGDFVVAATANNGRFSTDLANRSLPINLELHGDIHTRISSIGNPRHEFLPAHRSDIEAELCGLIENWKDAGCPLCVTVKHPMLVWAQTIGGILDANGFKGFLDNWSLERGLADAEAEALGILAHRASKDQHIQSGKCYRVADLLKFVEDEGLLPQLTEPQHRASDQSKIRQLGVQLSSHQDGRVFFDDDGEIHSYVIRKSRRDCHHRGTMATVYWFERVEVSQAQPITAINKPDAASA